MTTIPAPWKLRTFNCLSLLWVLSTSGTQAQTKRAVVIGNALYQHASKLSNPVNDAEAVARKLREGGFEVTLMSELDREAFRASLAEMSTVQGPTSFLVFYYAGHGVEIRGKNYLIPTDGNLKDELDVDRELIPLDEVLRSVSNSKVPLSLIVLDSCRDNPFEENSLLGQGLAALGDRDLPEGALVVYSGEPGKSVPDGTGFNSPFAERLLREARPGVGLVDLFTKVSIGIRDQRPWMKFDGSGQNLGRLAAFSLLPGAAGDNLRSGSLQDAGEALSRVQRAWEMVRKSDSHAARSTLLSVDPRNRGWPWAFVATECGFAPIQVEEVLASGLAGRDDADLRELDNLPQNDTGSVTARLAAGDAIADWEYHGRGGSTMEVKLVHRLGTTRLLEIETGFYGEFQNAAFSKEGTAFLLTLMRSDQRSIPVTNTGDGFRNSGSWITALPHLLFTGNSADGQGLGDGDIRLPDRNHISLALAGSSHLLQAKWQRSDDGTFRQVFDASDSRSVSDASTSGFLQLNQFLTKVAEADDGPIFWHLGIFEGEAGAAVLGVDGTLRIVDAGGKGLRDLNPEKLSVERSGSEEPRMWLGDGRDVVLSSAQADNPLVAAVPVGTDGRISVYRSVDGAKVADMRDRAGAIIRFGDIFRPALSNGFDLRFSPLADFLCFSSVDRHECRVLVWEVSTGKLVLQTGDEESGAYSSTNLPLRDVPLSSLTWMEDQSSVFLIWGDYSLEVASGDLGRRLGALNLPAEVVEEVSRSQIESALRSPDRQWIALAHVILKADNGEPVFTLPEGSRISPDWTLVVSPMESGTLLKVLDLGWWAFPPGQNPKNSNFATLAGRLLTHQMSSVYQPFGFEGVNLNGGAPVLPGVPAPAPIPAPSSKTPPLPR